ncbi:hypothetical protein [Alteribacter aurantiacus]|uniref:hypothetical protein n=1 Tax=Alteribacter aurantiacus TaxID=254410 RepID=UPI00041B2DAC|nr:hypothetical protein [Alteribacter aurantiacus]
MTEKGWIFISYFCLFIGIISWVPTVVFQESSGFWLLTFIVNPLGLLFGYLGKTKIGMIGNALLTASFYILMVLGYIIATLFGGKP